MIDNCNASNLHIKSLYLPHLTFSPLLTLQVALMAKMNSLPKVVHSPVNQENQPASPHSEWSPIRRQKPTTAEESYTMCTKHTHK